MRSRWALVVVATFAVATSLSCRSRLAASSGLTPAAEAREIVDEFADHAVPATTMDLSVLYGDAETRALLDPADALPTWHRYPYEKATSLFRYARSCRAEDAPSDAGSLTKALAWQRFSCGQAPAPDEAFFDTAPFMHPSGSSFALLASTARGGAWVAAHGRRFHVTELAAIHVDDPEVRLLAGLSRASLHAVARGDDTILDARWLLLRAPGAVPGGDVLRAFRRADWESYAERAPLTLVSRDGARGCMASATPDLCWAPRSSWVLRVALGLAVSALAVAVAAVVAERLRARRLANLDRALILRTLTHELRTPATALALELEPLRSAYDTLPAPLQEPLLGACDDIERIKRVLTISASWLSLQEAGRGFSLERLPAALPLLRGIVDGYGAEVDLVAAEPDAPITTDAHWLGIAVKNLIDNAIAHGRPPVRVVVGRRKRKLVVAVIDQGDTRGVNLAALTAAFHKGASSTGLGLGLAIVARVADALGGRLEHEATPTTFRLVVADLARWS